MRGPVALLALALVACAAPHAAPDGATSSSVTASATVVPSSPAPVAAGTGDVLRLLGGAATPPALPSEPEPIAASPVARTASEDDRRSAVLELLGGGERAARLPIRATDPGKAFDPVRRDRVAPRSRPPVVALGNVDVVGGLSKEIVQRLVRQRFGPIRACYEHALRRAPGAKGMASVTFRVTPGGQTKDVGATSTTLDAAMLGCLKSVFAGVPMPEPEGARAVAATVALRFAPNP